jgi:hypothetical protein
MNKFLNKSESSISMRFFVSQTDFSLSLLLLLLFLLFLILLIFRFKAFSLDFSGFDSQ